MVQTRSTFEVPRLKKNTRSQSITQSIHPSRTFERAPGEEVHGEHEEDGEREDGQVEAQRHFGDVPVRTVCVCVCMEEGVVVCGMHADKAVDPTFNTHVGAPSLSQRKAANHAKP